MLKGEKRRIAIVAALIVLGAVVLYELLEHFTPVKDAISTFMHVVAPILYGLCLAFVLNLPMSLLESKVFKKLKLKRPKLTRLICIFICYILFLGIIALIGYLIVPKLIDSIITLVNNLGSYVQAVSDQLEKWNSELHLSPEAYAFLERISETIMAKVNGIAANIIPQIPKYTVSVITVVYSLLVTFVISIHGLIKKEKLLNFARRIATAFIPERQQEMFFGYCTYANRTFKRYITGQLASCMILGILCYIAMRIFGMPYPELIAVFIGMAALIPIIGPWASTIISAFIILMSRIDNPWLALWFIVIIISIQALDDNLIAPRIVGDAIGVPGILVLAAIVVSGGLFGIGGLLIAVPTAAVIYKIFGDWVNRRNAAREKEKQEAAAEPEETQA